MFNQKQLKKVIEHTTKAHNEKKNAEDFVNHVMSELSANFGGVMLQLGYELGLFEAMKDGQEYNAKEIAVKTNTYERYIQEWLNCQAAGGYLNYNSDTKKYALSPEKIAVLADNDSPAFLLPGYNVVQSMWSDFKVLKEAFLTGNGIAWHEHHHSLFFGTEAFYKSGYKANLVNKWLPMQKELHAKLEKGALVADVGCGHGASTLLMAERYPKSVFYGFDYHTDSINVARERVQETQFENVFFTTKAALELNQKFDLICFMDAFHDLGDPLEAAKKSLESLNDGGSLLLVEPNAGDNVEDNFNPVGRMFYAASTALCVPHSNSEKGQCCLGAQAGFSRLKDILIKAGFSEVNIVERTPVNLIINALK